MPSTDLLTSVHLFGFRGDELLMVLLDRGWDIPGGHIERGETVEEALSREVSEEAGMTLHAPRLFALNEILLECAQPAEWRYPYPLSYQAFFIAGVAEAGTFKSTAEVKDRGLFAPAFARGIQWIVENAELYEASLAGRTS